MTKVGLLLISLILLVTETTGFCEDSTPLLGHNLTATTNTLRQNQIMAGTYLVGYGLTNDLTVGTNPWLVANYNMANLAARVSFPAPALFDRMAFETVYLKTLHFGFDWYHQESVYSRLSATKKFTETYKVHGSFGFQYFFDDLAPFSLRPPPLSGTPVTLSLSALQELDLSSEFGLFLESGVLGLNYLNRYLFLGGSFFIKRSWGYAQVGLSKSIPVGSDQLSGFPDPCWSGSSGGCHASVYYWNSAPIHPELQLEFLL